jgi:hypothetical protein
MQQHVSYLVRLWRMGDTVPSDPEAWPPNGAPSIPPLRITAMDPRTGEHWGFSEWTQLLAFLQQHTPVQRVTENQIQSLRHEPQQEV